MLTYTLMFVSMYPLVPDTPRPPRPTRPPVPPTAPPALHTRRPHQLIHPLLLPIPQPPPHTAPHRLHTVLPRQPIPPPVPLIRLPVLPTALPVQRTHLRLQRIAPLRLLIRRLRRPTVLLGTCNTCCNWIFTHVHVCMPPYTVTHVFYNIPCNIHTKTYVMLYIVTRTIKIKSETATLQKRTYKHYTI